MTKKQQHLVHGSLTAVVAFLAGMFSRTLYPAVIWFLAGAILGLGSQFIYVAPEKRRASRILLVMALGGAAAGCTALIVYRF